MKRVKGFEKFREELEKRLRFEVGLTHDQVDDTATIVIDLLIDHFSYFPSI